MGKKKNSTENEQKEEIESAVVPPGWKEPKFTKEDNPHGKITFPPKMVNKSFEFPQVSSLKVPSQHYSRSIARNTFKNVGH